MFIAGMGTGIWIGFLFAIILTIREDINKLEKQVDKLYNS